MGPDLCKIPFFQVLGKKHSYSFPEQKFSTFCKNGIFSLLTNMFPLWEKYDMYKNLSGSIHENCMSYSLFFSLFSLFLCLEPEKTLKFFKNVWNFFYSSVMYIVKLKQTFFTKKMLKKIFFLTQFAKNHFLEKRWD